MYYMFLYLQDDCSTPGSGIGEIENLNLHVGNKSRWINRGCKSSLNPLSQKIDISSACQANETCQTFNDCLCENSCEKMALNKLQQSAIFWAKTSRKRTLSESDTVSPVLAHMAKIFASDSSSWLLQSRNDLATLPIPVKRVMYEAPVDKWLRLGPSAHAGQPPRVKLLVHSNIWLLKHFKGRKDKASQEKDEKDIEKYVDEKENSITTDALSQAMKDVNFGSDYDTQDRQKISDSEPVKSVGKISSICSNPSWLLPKNLSGSYQVKDNKLKEQEISNKKHWLISSTEARPVLLDCRATSPSRVLGSPLSVTQAGVHSWLIKSFS